VGDQTIPLDREAVEAGGHVRPPEAHELDQLVAAVEEGQVGLDGVERGNARHRGQAAGADAAARGARAAPEQAQVGVGRAAGGRGSRVDPQAVGKRDRELPQCRRLRARVGGVAVGDVEHQAGGRARGGRRQLERVFGGGRHLRSGAAGELCREADRRRRGYP
jgi:hypothetical protein